MSYTHKGKFRAEMLYFLIWLIRKIRGVHELSFHEFHKQLLLRNHLWNYFPGIQSSFICLTSMTHKWNPTLTNINYSTSTLLLSKRNFNEQIGNLNISSLQLTSHRILHMNEIDKSLYIFHLFETNSNETFYKSYSFVTLQTFCSKV